MQNFTIIQGSPHASTHALISSVSLSSLALSCFSISSPLAFVLALIRGCFFHPIAFGLHDVAEGHLAADEAALRVLLDGLFSLIAVAAEAVGDGGSHGPLLEVGVEEEGEGGARKVPEVGHQPE